MNAQPLPQQTPLHLPVVLAIAYRGVAASLVAWRARRRQALDRRQLAEMSDHALSDLGIGRDQIRRLTDRGATREERRGH